MLWLFISKDFWRLGLIDLIFIEYWSKNKTRALPKRYEWPRMFWGQKYRGENRHLLRNFIKLRTIWPRRLRFRCTSRQRVTNQRWIGPQTFSFEGDGGLKVNYRARWQLIDVNQRLIKHRRNYVFNGRKERPNETFSKDSRLEITYTMGLNANKVSRSVYTFWNVLGDIGGLYGVLALACANLISILTYHKSTNYLASQLYSARCPLPSNPLVSQTETQLNLTR